MKLLLSIISVAVFITGFSQLNNFRSYSIEDGLPQSTVYSLLQDSRGYIWLGTDGGGVCRFDGRNIEVFNRKSGLSGNVVRSMYEDKSGNIWLGTDHGITFYNGYSFDIIKSPDELNQGTVLCFYEDNKGNVWAGSDNGLFKISVKNSTFDIVRYSTSDGLVTNFIFDLYIDENQVMWLAMYGGIHMVDLNQEKLNFKEVYSDFVTGKMIISIKKYEDKFYFGTYENGLIALNTAGNDSGNFYRPSFSERFSESTIWDIVLDSEKNLWLCTDKSGVFRVKGEKVSNYSETEGLKNNQILCALEDHEKNLWFGTMGSGLIRHLGDCFSHYTTSSGLLYDQISGISQDENKDFWLSSIGGGLIKMTYTDDKPGFISFLTDKGLLDNNINSVFLDDERNIWLATQNGISVFDGKKFYSITEENGLVDNRVNCIHKDKKGIVWIGTGAGLSIYRDNEFLNITQESQYEIANDKIQTIIEDKAGNIWVGTLGGLIRFVEGQMTQFNETDGLNDNSIHALCEDKKGNIWIGTFGGGLYRFDAHSTESVKIRLIAGDSLLSSQNIYSLIFVNEKTLIAGTDKGFDRITLDEDLNIVSVRSYDRSDGFMGVENKLNAIYRDTDNNIWFGTVKGLTKYSPLSEKINVQPPRIYITDIDLFFENVDWKTIVDSVSPWFNIPASLTLAHSKNHITFKFNAISLSNPLKIKYKYKLTGLDNDWSPEREENEVVYSGLAPGDYVFEVIAANENNIWSEVPCRFSFTINPPFWQTIWFISLSIFVLILLIYIFIRLRERKLKQEKAMLEQKVEERTREIADQNRKLAAANEEIIEQKELIEEKNKDIMDSIRYAKRIQEALLPPDDYFSQFLKSYFVLFKPKDIVSGDFYWMHDCEGKILIAAVDCTGHGVPGAFMSIVGHNGLNQAVMEYGLTVPSHILDKLNIIVNETLSQKRADSGIRDGMDMTLCSLDYTKMELEFAGAKNPIYFIRDNELTEYKGDKQPIGAMEEDYTGNYSNHRLTVKKGDVIYMFSDGYADQFGGTFGKKYKYKTFKNTLLELHQMDMNIQKEKLDNVIEKWRGNLEQVDDILVIGIRI